MNIRIRLDSKGVDYYFTVECEEFIPYVEHLELPPAFAGDTSIWRYLSLATFLALLERQTLHFTRLDLLSDPFVDFESQPSLNSVPPMSEDTIRRWLDMMRIARQAVFANCWYASLSDSPQRWEGHGGTNNAVAIRSTVEALRTALRESTQRIHISNVQYIDYATSPKPLGNAFFPALHKHCDLRDEREVRALLLQVGQKGSVFSPGPEQGVEVKIDTADLIKEVLIAPRSDDWFCTLIADVAKRYGAARPLRT